MRLFSKTSEPEHANILPWGFLSLLGAVPYTMSIVYRRVGHRMVGDTEDISKLGLHVPDTRSAGCLESKWPENTTWRTSCLKWVMSGIALFNFIESSKVTSITLATLRQLIPILFFLTKQIILGKNTSGGETSLWPPRQCLLTDTTNLPLLLHFRLSRITKPIQFMTC